MATSVQEISQAGGPSPLTNESKTQYYTRVQQWANSKGFVTTYDDLGYPTVRLPMSKGGTHITTGTPVGGETDPEMIASASLSLLPLVIGGVGVIAGALMDGSGNGGGGGVVADIGNEIVGGVLRGAGLPEPDPGTFYKTWTSLAEYKNGNNVRTYFWAMNDGTIISYQATSKRAKRWRPKKPIAVVMPQSKMSMTAFMKLERYVDRVTKKLAKRSSRLKIQH